ncbi:DUF5049 domain-containing protein [Clostridium sp. DSM 17811]|nr:DUF5049 domain-containing protein [Clostridium sp. DSM 17811]
MFNTECICLGCCEKEKQDKDYNKASKADHDEIKKGNYNYEGLRGQKKVVSDKIVGQILLIRKHGQYNMVDTVNVQREAYNREFYELVSFLEEHKKEYLNFILTGDR